MKIPLVFTAFVLLIIICCDALRIYYPTMKDPLGIIAEIIIVIFIIIASRTNDKGYFTVF